ncbi:histidine phosphatase family protein [Rhizobium sp. AG855]|uniref:SixA phosphatase family protein n=1 Tax=Rhizobium sp. AG855 TaxID=2183898 RepID=UPI000E71FC70|nr:histidine phosphatase family protein [Rhizobium sp. AG855]RKE84479.1 phosphohistidine phosphatase [Rhizobium sp. AG855]
MTPSNLVPKRIYLLRHAKSGWAEPGGRDFDRNLSDAGFAEAELLAETAADRNYRPDLVIASTAKRCRQTAEALNRVFSGLVEFRYVDELYNAPAETYLEILASTPDIPALMLVGHNPAIEEVFARLCGNEVVARTVPEGYPTSGLAVIDAVEQSWRLHDFIVG